MKDLMFLLLYQDQDVDLEVDLDHSWSWSSCDFSATVSFVLRDRPLIIRMIVVRRPLRTRGSSDLQSSDCHLVITGSC